MSNYKISYIFSNLKLLCRTTKYVYTFYIKLGVLLLCINIIKDKYVNYKQSSFYVISSNTSKAPHNLIIRLTNYFLTI